ncbi:BTB domain-containing protein [Caenorhabditis elegans]|uniref:BTB domain-containing protein n=1 Tax=Caenorhabditis elegans TaxID=6239 RepID=Q9BLB4_CAEEL|nr:BTB domain-containing protein [Caenorhabditis elegans]CCD65549.2 BTB domain-containing protein [Caenorhabditis elegans]
MVDAPGTEVNDTRVIIGKGLSLDSIKFPDFHMFDTNWKMKLHAEWSEELETEVVSIKLRHRRRNVDDIWSMDATVKIHFEQDWLKGEVQVDSQFSNQGQEIEILNCGTVVGKLNSSEIHLCVHIFMQINQSKDTIVLVDGVKFHVNRMILSMASPIFLEAFVTNFDERSLKLCNISAPDFRRILNIIYPPHLPPKQWIKESDLVKQFEHIQRILRIGKSLQISIVLEVADKWLVKYGRHKLGDTLHLVQAFGLRKLMGSKLAKMRSLEEIKKCQDQIQVLSRKTKALILDRILSTL